jgi:hypothetical protein
MPFRASTAPSLKKTCIVQGKRKHAEPMVVKADPTWGYRWDRFLGDVKNLHLTRKHVTGWFFVGDISNYKISWDY